MLWQDTCLGFKVVGRLLTWPVAVSEGPGRTGQVTALQAERLGSVALTHLGDDESLDKAL